MGDPVTATYVPGPLVMPTSPTRCGRIPLLPVKSCPLPVTAIEMCPHEQIPMSPMRIISRPSMSTMSSPFTKTVTKGVGTGWPKHTPTPMSPTLQTCCPMRYPFSEILGAWIVTAAALLTSVAPVLLTVVLPVLVMVTSPVASDMTIDTFPV